MSPVERESFLIILCIAVTAPIVAELIPRIRLPVVVLEIVLGIIVGPQVLGWAQPSPILTVFGRFGMAFLFFVAGLEIDFKAIRGRPITNATWGWLLSLGIAIALGAVLERIGIVESGLLLAGALTTTAIGTLLPILRDAGETETVFGRFMMAAGALGEFGPIILISAVLTSGSPGSHSGGPMSLVLLVVFTLITLAAAYVAGHARPTYIVNLLERKLHTSAQLPVRVAVLLLAALIMLTMQIGLDAVLGAIAAGIVVSIACGEGHSGEVVRHKLEGIAFGFFIPIFFVMSGVNFDLRALLGSNAALARLPLFLTLFLVARGLPVLLCRRDLPARDLFPLALLSATALPLVVAIAEIGVETDRLKSENAASLVGAAMASVLIFPLLALSLRKSRQAPAGSSQTTYESATR